MTIDSRRAAALRVCLTAVLVTALVVTGAATADGKFFSSHSVPPTIPGQQAIVVFDGSTQTLVIDTEVMADDGGELAWVIPVPSLPEVSATTRGTVATCAFVTSEVRLPRRFAVSGAMLMALVVVPALVVLVLPRPNRSSLTAAGLVTLVPLMIVAVFLPGLGSARGGAEGVTVHSSGDAGDFAFSVIGGRDAGELAAWLRERGVVVSAAAESVIDAYAAEGWVFVAGWRRAAGTGDDAAARTPAHPVVLRFPTERPIYPMRLTGADAADPILLRLYVFADGGARAESLETIACLPVERWGPSRRVIAQRRPGVAKIGHVELLGLVGSRTHLTRLEARLEPGELARDIEIELGPPTVRQEIRRIAAGGRSGAPAVAIVISGAIAYGVAILALVLGWGRNLRRVGAAIGLVAALVVLIGGRQLDLNIEERERPLRAVGVHVRSVESIGDTVRRMRRDGLDESAIVSALATEGSFLSGQFNPLIRRRMEFLDGPGDFTVTVVDGQLVYRWYDATGNAFDLPIEENPDRD